MIAAARERLARAHAAVAEADQALDLARHAAGSARAFAAAVQSDVDRFNAIDDGIAAARASALMEAMRAARRRSRRSRPSRTIRRNALKP